jgi:hypothetical protein
LYPFIIGFLFLPPALGLLRTITGEISHNWSASLLALGTFLLCLEQAHMATADLLQIEATQRQVQDQRLDQFRWVTQSTIAIELVGFYIAGGWLGWGAFTVLLSQAWFNLLAQIRLHPEAPEPIQVRSLADRLPVLIADGVGLLLASFWIAQIAPLVNAALLLTIVLLYGWFKYIRPAQPQTLKTSNTPAFDKQTNPAEQ